MNAQPNQEPARHWRRCGGDAAFYPPRSAWSGTYCYADYLRAVASGQVRNGRPPLALALHIPAAVRGRAAMATYLDYLRRDIDLQAKLFAPVNQVERIFLTGNTTALGVRQLAELMDHVRQAFWLIRDAFGHYEIDTDGSASAIDHIEDWHQQGFDRLTVRAAPYGKAGPGLAAIVGQARLLHVKTITVELACCHPKQNVFTFGHALDRAVAVAPERIVLVCSEAPSPVAADLHALARRRLLGAGYVEVSHDCFASSGDELVTAQRQGRLYHTPYGYAVQPLADLVGCGAGAVGMVGASYSENAPDLARYYEGIDRNEVPVVCGKNLSMDDLIRRAVIDKLTCAGELSMSALELAFPISFRNYFASELQALQAFQDAQLLAIGEEWISVTASGRMLVPAIAAVFHHRAAELISPDARA
jgi:oxygen-independent coproporphyrinogen-3 oxidase